MPTKKYMLDLLDNTIDETKKNINAVYQGVGHGVGDTVEGAQQLNFDANTALTGEDTLPQRLDLQRQRDIGQGDYERLSAEYPVAAPIGKMIGQFAPYAPAIVFAPATLPAVVATGLTEGVVQYQDRPRGQDRALGRIEDSAISGLTSVAPEALMRIPAVDRAIKGLWETVGTLKTDVSEAAKTGYATVLNAGEDVLDTTLGFTGMRPNQPMNLHRRNAEYMRNNPWLFNKEVTAPIEPSDFYPDYARAEATSMDDLYSAMMEQINREGKKATKKIDGVEAEVVAHKVTESPKQIFIGDQELLRNSTYPEGTGYVDVPYNQKGGLMNMMFNLPTESTRVSQKRWDMRNKADFQDKVIDDYLKTVRAASLTGAATTNED